MAREQSGDEPSVHLCSPVIHNRNLTSERDAALIIDGVFRGLPTLLALRKQILEGVRDKER